MHCFYRAVTLLVLVFLTTSVLAKVAKVEKVPDPLFQDDETLDVTITAPFKTLVRKRPKDDYLPGMLQYKETDGTTVNFDLKIRTRGHFRHETCKYPPLTLNFKKSQTKGTLFDKQDKLKLVIHCDRSERYQQVVLREYLAYRLLNAITGMSFRVRLLRVTYVNNEVQEGGQVRYGFLIEHKNRFAKRFGTQDLKVERTSVAAIQPDRLNLTSVFEFLLGNTDFSPIAGAPDDECCHNYVLFGNDIDPVIAVPYDFDQSGFVDAPYAAPGESLHIRSVQQRLYRGRCVNNQYIAASLSRFKDRRDSIYALVNEQVGLNSRVRKNLIRYVDKFYDLIEDPEAVERKIINKCL